MSMTFCGQCGYQLTAGMRSCPRCGTAAEADIEPTIGNTHADDQTIASQAFIARNPNGPATPNNPQRLVLRPRPGSGSSYEDPFGATSRVDAPGFGIPGQAGTYPPTTSQFPGASQPGILPQGGQQGYMTQGGGGIPQQGASYPGFASQPGFPPQIQQAQYQQQQQQQAMARAQEEQTARSARGRTTGLVLILVGLLFILSAVVLFIIQASTRASNGIPDAIAQAQTALQHYLTIS